MSHEDQSPSIAEASPPGAQAADPSEWLAPNLLAAQTPEGELMRASVRQRLFGGSEPAYRFDRFIVLGRLGAGGMGVVFEAYDPQLDRKVALKVVRPGRAPEDDVARQRLLREARALARLSHPNVVPVFEVGEQGLDVFIAMELVRGQTLHQLARAPERSPHRIVQAYIQASRGLAAAHREGLVHRDFKPSNAIMGEDGRVRVLDFGLAREAGSVITAGLAHLQPPTAISSPGSSLVSLTTTGAVVGTPAYMAPEQRMGDPVTAASDQYSLCASLHEALTGRLPAVSLDGRAERGQGRLGELQRCPRRLRPVLARGLALEPKDRWPSMDALVIALERASGRRMGWLAAGLGLGLGGALVAALVLPEPSPCADDQAALAGVWDSSRREAVEAALRSTGLELAPQLAEDATQALDEYAEDWAELHTQSCVAHHVDEIISDELFDRTVTCLERRRGRLAALVERLPAIDASATPRVMEAIAALPRLEPCRDHEALLSALPPPEDPAVVAGVAEVRDRLDRSLTIERLGNLDEALELALDGMQRAQALDYRPIQAEAAQTLGALYLTRRELDQAVAQLDEALWLAEAGGHDELVAQSASQLAVALGMQGKLDEARALARRTRAAIERVGGHTQASVVLESGLANVARLEGRLEEAREAYARAVEHAEALLDADPAYVGEHVDNLAAMIAALGDHAHGLELRQRAYALKRAGLGELHPSVLQTRLDLALVHVHLGHPDQALSELQAVLHDLERSAEGASEMLGVIHTNLAVLHGEAGHHAESLAHAEQAVAISREVLGPSDPELLPVLTMLASAHDRSGQVAEARVATEEAVALARSTAGEGPRLASVLLSLAVLDRREGDPQASLHHVDEALPMLERTVGERHTQRSRGHMLRGRALQALGRLPEALESAHRALETAPSTGRPADRARGAAEHLLAELLDAQGERAKAIEHARSALAAYERVGKDDEAQELRTWLDEHAMP